MSRQNHAGKNNVGQNDGEEAQGVVGSARGAERRHWWRRHQPLGDDSQPVKALRGLANVVSYGQGGAGAYQRGA